MVEAGPPIKSQSMCTLHSVHTTTSNTKEGHFLFNDALNTVYL